MLACLCLAIEPILQGVMRSNYSFARLGFFLGFLVAQLRKQLLQAFPLGFLHRHMLGGSSRHQLIKIFVRATWTRCYREGQVTGVPPARTCRTPGDFIAALQGEAVIADLYATLLSGLNPLFHDLAYSGLLALRQTAQVF